MDKNRELITLASKAAEIGPLDFDYSEREGHGFYFGPRLPMPEGVLMGAMWTYWRPLENDGDALRLAIKLRLKIDMDFRIGDRDTIGVGVWIPGDIEYYPPFWMVNCKDIGSATRNTIVRAAASIGEKMP